MIAFIGLGNVGDQYEKQSIMRVWVIDKFAQRKNFYLVQLKLNMFFAIYETKQVLLVKPTTGMNRSGLAVKSIIKKWNLLISNIYVVIDDVDLPAWGVKNSP